MHMCAHTDQKIALRRHCRRQSRHTVCDTKRKSFILDRTSIIFCSRTSRNMAEACEKKERECKQYSWFCLLFIIHCLIIKNVN